MHEGFGGTDNWQLGSQWELGRWKKHKVCTGGVEGRLETNLCFARRAGQIFVSHLLYMQFSGGRRQISVLLARQLRSIIGMHCIDRDGTWDILYFQKLPIRGKNSVVKQYLSFINKIHLRSVAFLLFNQTASNLRCVSQKKLTRKLWAASKTLEPNKRQEDQQRGR